MEKPDAFEREYAALHHCEIPNFERSNDVGCTYADPIVEVAYTWFYIGFATSSIENWLKGVSGD